jgi:hypothetical protein
VTVARFPGRKAHSKRKLTTANQPDHLGKRIGNTGRPTDVQLALRGSFSARHGEIVRVPHTERDGQAPADCLRRIVGISRSNVLWSDALEGGATLNFEGKSGRRPGEGAAIDPGPF